MIQFTKSLLFSQVQKLASPKESTATEVVLQFILGFGRAAALAPAEL